jgi:hypothetical protein
MPRVESIQTVDFQVTVEVDPYVPLAIRTYAKPLGAVFYRVGNFKTSLIELPIDPQSRLVRGLKVLSFDCVKPIGGDYEHLPQVVGLPVICSETMPTERIDEVKNISVSLGHRRFFIDWSERCEIELRATLDRLTFFIGNNRLLGAMVGGLSELEAEQIKEHIR